MGGFSGTGRGIVQQYGQLLYVTGVGGDLCVWVCGGEGGGVLPPWYLLAYYAHVTALGTESSRKCGKLKILVCLIGLNIPLAFVDVSNIGGRALKIFARFAGRLALNDVNQY